MRIYAARLYDKNGTERVRKLLSYGYKELYGKDMPEILKTEKGKPYFSDDPNVFFSLSHTDNYVMCAIGKSPVGCDIQNVRPVSAKTVQRACIEKELECFSFFQLWTLKESWIKLNGFISGEIKNIQFSGTVDSIIPPSPAVAARLYVVDGCVAAVCSADNDIPIKLDIIENI